MLKLEAGAATDAGLERIENQDHVWAQIYQTSSEEPIGLFIVCDGVGGHHGGKFASHWAVEALKAEFDDLFCPGDPRKTVSLSNNDPNHDQGLNEITQVSELRKLENSVRLAVQQANQVVYEYALQKPDLAADAGTTITMAVVVGNKAVIANVGDSRTYLLRDGDLRQITQDHSLVATLVASGQILPEDVFTHPQRNLIFRSLGQKNEIQVDTFIELLQRGDQLLLCSDGLWEMVQDEKILIQHMLGADTPQAACQSLVEAANRFGGQDNIGVVIAALK